ncbi:MAG TPA: helix-turn-helix domain-containing protein [Bacteroidia bacterium]|nr:helix-turn-helix domain-containing protein [Bacteroidia bacterium]
MTKRKSNLLKDWNGEECAQNLLPVKDALYILSGKWKLPIIIALAHGHKRFKELQREIRGITARMLSKELREMEINQLVKRTVYDTTPVSVEYELTAYGFTLDNVIIALRDWGLLHRKKIAGKK